MANKDNKTNTLETLIGKSDYVSGDILNDYSETDTGTEDASGSSKITSDGTAQNIESNESDQHDTSNLPNIALVLPQWGYSDFMTERMNWQKGLNDVGGEPGWFYFKIFFHFNTAHGLFGGQLHTSNNEVTANRTCARSFFQLWGKHYPKLDMDNRALALSTFTNMLNNISNNTPWFFQSISGIDKAHIQNLNEPFKDNTIEIKCLEESIDMRLSTLFEYYKYACFDYVNLKEIVPENLRKFDMSVVVFGVPIRYLDTHSKIKGSEFKAKTMRGESGNAMTMAMYTFKGCEFDIENMSEPVLSDMNNAHAFQNNSVSIKIKYNKVFNYKQNGFTGSSISTLGMIDNAGDTQARLRKLSDAYNTMQRNSTATATADAVVDKFIGNRTQFSKWYKTARSMGVGSTSKALIDETEAICQNYYNNVATKAFNTFVGKGVLGASELGSITPPDKGIGTKYYEQTLDNIYYGTIKQSDSSVIGNRTSSNYKNNLVR